MAAQMAQKSQAGFIENKGQLVDQHGKPNKQVKYLLNMPGLNVQLRQNGFSYDTYLEKRNGEKRSKQYHRVDIQLEGANPDAVITAAKPLGGMQSVINERGEFNNISQYEKVTYHNIYPGIDLEFVAGKANGKPVEYNFIVRPGGDASKINLRYQGAKSTALSNEMIVMNLQHGKLSENIPASWLSQGKKPVSVHYKALGSDVYAFNVPMYDKTKTLVIDPTPTLEWATYYGGTGDDIISAIDTDTQGNIYVVGSTTSVAGVATAGAYAGGLSSSGTPNTDMFIAKFNQQGQRLWSTYYGGILVDAASTVTAVNGKVYFGRRAQSDNLASLGAHQTYASGRLISFLGRLDANTG